MDCTAIVVARTYQEHDVDEGPSCRDASQPISSGTGSSLKDVLALARTAQRISPVDLAAFGARLSQIAVGARTSTDQRRAGSAHTRTDRDQR
jgi:hypothetical protein